MKLRIYTIPSAPLNDASEIVEKIFNYLGPALVDSTGWGLLRPGLLTRQLVNNVSGIWKAERTKELAIYDRPQLRGDWIFFDYLFSKPTSINSIVKCLKSLGLIRYGEIKLTDTYLITVGLNYKFGIILVLYNGKKVESQLNDIVCVLSYILDALKPKVIEINEALLTKLAMYFVSSPRWQLRSWTSKEGRTIELDLVQKNREEYLSRLKRGEWQSLLFQDSYSKVKLTMRPRTKNIDVFIKMKFYKPGPKRELRPVFEELTKGIVPNKVSDVTYSSSDEAGILRAYTERRGVMAVLKFEKEKNKKEAFDVSYEFKGYDVKAEPYLIEVKSFRDSAYKSLQLTQNEYKVMCEEENYRIYVVEEAWDKVPRVSIIDEPNKIYFKKQVKDIIETRIASQEYFECEEDRWRNRVVKTDFIEL
ncbi:MAG: protein NO VEIN domain-containing protein [Thermoproteota archaeon]|jgi:hypothetical protein